MISTATMATADGASGADEEWFGEGSAFDSGEDLAAALFALAGASPNSSPQAAEVIWPSGTAVEADPVFVEVQRLVARQDGARPAASRAGGADAASSARSWSVRPPGESLLPRTVSGRSGWTIRNSVAVLHRTEAAIARLREDAVELAFLAAAEACGRGRPHNLERRRFAR